MRRELLVLQSTARSVPDHTQFLTQDLPVEQRMVYCIFNEFLGHMKFNNPDAEELLLTTLADGPCLTPSMEQRIEEVFSPILF